MDPWDVQLLGGIAVSRNGEAARFRTRATASIFAYLALHAGRPIPRETLISLEWPNSPQEQGRQSLRTALTSLRQALGVEALEIDRSCVRLIPSFFRIDIHEFRRTRDPALYRGRLVDGFEWAEPASAALHEEFLTAVLSAMDSRPGEARAIGEKALEVDPGLLAVRAKLRDIGGVSLPRAAPIVATSFVGRRREIDQIESLLRSHRLVTLTGLGGSGKSRLAAEVWRRQQPDCWFVRLADLADPNSVPEAILRTLGLPPSSSRSAIDQIAELPEGLLILDSFEHLIEASPFVAAILERCPTLRILVTSQLTLDLVEEVEYAVGPLSIAGSETQSNEGMLLFEERARSIVPDFRLTPENSDAVAELCRRLDGFPLAIELAAARSRVFSPSEMLAQLEDRLGFLTRRSGREGRQGSLRAALDWTFERLPEPAQLLLTQLSVFRGGFTLEAVREVCACEQAASLVETLIAHSWIERLGTADQTRFRLLESIREFCGELLRPSEAKALSQRRAAFYLQLASRSRASSFSRDEQLLHRLVAADVHNLDAAWVWLLANDSEGALLLAETLNWYWILNGQASLGEFRIKQALSIADPTPRPLLTAAHHTCGNYILFQGRFRDSLRWFQRGYALAVETGDDLFQGFTLGQLGHALAELGEHEAAWTHAEKSLEHFLSHGSENWIGAGYTMLALVANRSGDCKRALEMARIGLERYTAAGYEWGRASALNELAMACHLLGRYEEARRYQEEGIAIKRAIDAQGSLALSLSDLAATLMRQGDDESALSAIKECLRILERTGHFERFPRLYGVAAQIALKRGDHDLATQARATMLRLAGGRPLNQGEIEADAETWELANDTPAPQPIEAVARAILAL